MTDEDIFREVEEDLRREQLKAYWDKFGTYVIATAVAIVVAVAGYKGWTSWVERQAADAGTQFVHAQKLVDDGKTDEAGQAFARLINEAPNGYRILSKFQLASTKVSQGKVDEAVNIYDQLAKSGDLDPVLEGFAKIQAAMLVVDNAKQSDIINRLSQMTATNNYWRHSAREILGLSAYKAENYEEARGYYDAIISDEKVPFQLKSRAEMMLKLLNSKLKVSQTTQKPENLKKDTVK